MFQYSMVGELQGRLLATYIVSYAGYIGCPISVYLLPGNLHMKLIGGSKGLRMFGGG